MGYPLQVVLVLGLRFPEGCRGCDLGDHRAGPQAACLDIADGGLGDLPLRVGGVKDLRAIGRTGVVALPVYGGRVVDLEEECQQIPKPVMSGSKVISIASA